MLIILSIFSSLMLIFITRILMLIVTRGNAHKLEKGHARTLIVIGSGGHTTEILRQVIKIQPQLYYPRLYVMADSDSSSESKIISTEQQIKCKDGCPEAEYQIQKLPRSRCVNQSYLSSIFTTIYSIVMSTPIVVSFKPDLILCNGPGTCIPICFISFLLNVMLYTNTKIIFIESICRVKTLSLSGKILMYFANKVLVQWPQLHTKYPKSVYIGRLM